MNKIKNVLAAVLIMVSFSFANAEGVLGTNYVEVDASYSAVDYGFFNLDLMGVGVAYNQNVMAEDAYGVDLGVTFGWLTDNESSFNADQYTIGAGGVLFYDATETMRPFVSLGLGYVWVDMDGADEDSFAWQGGVGVEWEAVADLTVTPSVIYSDATSIDDSEEWTYGVEVAYWFTEQFNAGVSYAYSDLKYGVDGDTVGVSARWRF